MLDATTTCSDAFRVAADLGAAMDFPENMPPHLVDPLIVGPADLSKIGRPDPTAAGSRMADRVNGVAELARATGDERMVVGWIEMPFAEACCLCGVADFMMLLIQDPKTAHAILDAFTAIAIDFGLAQYAAGAPMIGAGDAAASLISPEMYREFALPYEQRVTQALHEAGATVKLHICGDSRKILSDMTESGSDLYNLDHPVPLDSAREMFGPKQMCYKGNIDPALLMNLTPEECRDLVHQCMAATQGTRYMLSAGCEVSPMTPNETFGSFCEAVLSFAG